MIRTLKRFLPHELRQRIKRSLFVQQDMASRLANLRRAGFAATGAVDGGAYRGEWTTTFWSVWPGCPVALVEPQPERQSALRALAATTPGSFVVSSALGRAAGDVAFRLGETDSAIVPDGSEQASIVVPCTTLDAVLDTQPAFEPNLLKLDLQGGEMEAIAGAERHLPQFDVVVIEVSLLQIGDGPIFGDVERTMETRGYRLYDVIPQYYRPLDGALWQMDAFYVRRDSALVASRSWA